MTEPVAARRGGPESSEVTSLLRRWGGGDASARDALMPVLHGELRKLARARLRREREGHTLEPTALVHEAYIRLVDQRVQWVNRAHFFALAAQAMRRVLVDHARAHVAAKRGGHAERVTLTGAIAAAAAPAGVDVLWLHEALDRLAELDARQARVVELRYFAGMSVEEVAEVLGISPATVKREWQTARLWLARALDGDDTSD